MGKFYEAYVCPKCKEEFTFNEAKLVCQNNHSFDFAKEGYVNLILANQKKSLKSGDGKEMIKARNDFLRAGYYDFLLEGFKELDFLKNRQFENVLDIGCGSGFYLNFLAGWLKPELALGSDVSKDAIKFCAKAYKDLNFSVCNSFNLPFKEQFFDLVLSVFSPFEKTEIERIIKDNGVFLLVRPGDKHLEEIN